jgi:hypothetical protein
VIDALSPLGITEYVHNPSLVDHCEGESAIGNNPQPEITTFRGEAFDLLELGKC